VISAVDLDTDLGLMGLVDLEQNGPQKREKNGTQFITKNFKLSL
jgi:hypothetical protein